MAKYSLNKFQQEAIEYTDGPLLIVAGAGTGKTTVITQKISYLIASKLAKPEEILALTFTDKAANEMQERIDEIVDSGYVDMQISTFHSFCQKILEQYGLDIGLPNKSKLLTVTDAWLLIRKNLDKFSLDYYRPLGNPTRHIHELIKHFSKCKDELITPADYLKYAEESKNNNGSMEQWDNDYPRLTEIANAYHVYNQLLLDNGSLDFGDLIFYTIKLLKERPNILQALQNRFRYILIDEFQDVNWAQYQLVRLLVGKKSQLTVVGDDDQSIYAFRGASVSNILRFKDDYPRAKEIVLTENYRSGQEILDLAYKSIQNNNPDRLEVKLNINKRLKSKVENKMSKVEYKHFNTLDEEVAGVVNKICEICENKSVALSEIAILVRANSHAEPFINALAKKNIPYEYLASAGLYKQPIILDCINFLKVIDSYHESTSIYRLLQLSFLNFSENDLQKLTYLAKKKTVSYYEALKHATEFGLSAAGIKICDKLLGLINEGVKQARKEKLTVILYNFLNDSGYLTYLAHEEEQGNRELIRQIYFLRQFLDFVSEFETNQPGVNVALFLEQLNYVLEAGDEGKIKALENVEQSVKIMTIHSAKGLEFSQVFVVNLVEERFPTRKHGEGIEIPLSLIKEHLPEGDYHYEEERRLFYVAITRAKEKLFLTSADDYGGVRKKKMSRFLAELDYEPKAIKQINSLSIDKLSNGQNAKNETKSAGIAHLPNTFSYSQINSYGRCPYQYKLAYVLKLPTKSSASFSFGSTIHNTLQKFYQKVQELNSAKQDSLFGAVVEVVNLANIKVPVLTDLLKLYEECWIDDWYESAKQKEDYHKKGREILKVFYTAQENNWTVPSTLESGFKIKIGNYTVRGRIDRVDKLSDGTLEIIDYKTGKAKEKVTGDDKDQLLIYQLAVIALPEYRNIGKIGKLSFFYLNDNIKISFVGEAEELQKLQEKLLKIIEQISLGDFAATPGDHVCSYCDFKGICEFRKL